MSDPFFSNYKAFVVVPADEKQMGPEPFSPNDYASHFILTFSLYDAVISSWREATKYKVQAKKGLSNVIEGFNAKRRGTARLHLLEMEEDQAYFVLALSLKIQKDNEKAVMETITNLLDKDFATDLLIGETWYQIIGAKGKFERKLFSYNVQPYDYRPK
ncbi:MULTISPECIES: hypothetical protein [Bacillales]|uniref:hypothetical protein n=1 Tax=Bacillales TaxID=1385 RepID=UPI000346A891|nr:MULTISPECIES: hypothetical protein [Bacillales]KMZ40085.1 hypothetical protein AC624_02870 [Bacillus sp. FJAT-27238]